jgi:hypothetical protein
VEHEGEQAPSGEDGGMIVYSLADQPEGRMTIAVAVLVQEGEVREGAGRYYGQDATFLPQEPLHDILVC